MCPGTVLPGSQGVVGHIGKVQKWEEVLGANHAKALGEVGVHPVQEERNRLVGEHLPWLQSQLRTSKKKGINSSPFHPPTPHPTSWLPSFPSSPPLSDLGGTGPDAPSHLWKPGSQHPILFEIAT